MVIPPEMAVSYAIQMSYGHFLWVFLAPWKFQMGVPPWGGHKGGLIWWGQQGGPAVPEFHPLPLQVHADDRFLRTEQGLLLRALQSGDSGLYSCTATENNFKHIITRVQLHVLGCLKSRRTPCFIGRKIFNVIMIINSLFGCF